MKKSIFIAVLGVAAVAATSSYGQGNVYFTSYLANGGAGATTSVWNGGALIGVGYTAELYYAIGTVSDPVNMTSMQSITSPISALFTAIPSSIAEYDNSGAATGAPGLGYFDGTTVIIPGYSSGPVSLEIYAFNSGGSVVGRSGAWTESSIPLVGLPASTIGDNGVVPNFVVAPVPEPATLALAGLGGLASLVALRRKQA